MLFQMMTSLYFKNLPKKMHNDFQPKMYAIVGDVAKLQNVQNTKLTSILSC